jgi:RHS repeat-associated protein
MQDLEYGFDADGNIIGITDHLDATRSQVFQYDALNRLTYASGLYGALTYGYDAVGNRTSQSGGTTNLAETYSYAANSNQLQSVVNGTVTRSLAYSPTGNVASDNRGNGTALSFTYDLSDRMVQVANQNTPLASYAYNYLGQRAAKTTPSAITQFVYDRSGHLLAESNGATGTAQTEYVWLDDTPLALATSGNLYFIHSDHLGTPQKATDASQNLAWDIVPRPFGQTEQQTFPPLANLRFPGQYFDTETGMHSNYFRDYDSTIGRYIETDPLGIDATIYGITIASVASRTAARGLYTYGENNPTDHIDPYGLYTVQPGLPPPSSAIANLLNCIEAKTGDPLVVTSTSEPIRPHPPGTPHRAGTAVDIRYPTNPDKILCAAAECGANFGLDEKKHPSPQATGPHIHLQIPPGKRGGRGDLPKLPCRACG